MVREAAPRLRIPVLPTPIKRDEAIRGSRTAPPAPSAPAYPPGPAPGKSRTAMGFTVAARSGPHRTSPHGVVQRRAIRQDVFSGIFRQVSGYFDGPPSLLTAVADAQDQEVQVFFRSSYQRASRCAD